VPDACGKPHSHGSFFSGVEQATGHQHAMIASDSAAVITSATVVPSAAVVPSTTVIAGATVISRSITVSAFLELAAHSGEAQVSQTASGKKCVELSENS
jgi:hypothetical protein